jgi:outer membrane protein OmpA-like peptidoglycan-associated protein
MKMKFSLQTACLALCMGMTLSSASAYAQQEMGTLSYYGIPESEYRDHEHEWQVFLEYNLHREQCQHYQAPPAGYVMHGCHIYHADTVMPAASVESLETTTTTAAPVKTVVQSGSFSSTIYFDFDKSNIRPGEREKIGQAAQDIQKYNPKAVTVSSHTDSSGAEDYNQRLSERRAQAVAQALGTYGIKAEIIDQDAYGERGLAVPTADGVKMPENRRVVIDFSH